MGRRRRVATWTYPYSYLVARTYKKWGMRMDDTCLCGEGAETFLHMQLACKLKNRRATIQGAHDDVMRGVWDTRVGDLC